jgi:hypothetical protein
MVTMKKYIAHEEVLFFDADGVAVGYGMPSGTKECNDLPSPWQHGFGSE